MTRRKRKPADEIFLSHSSRDHRFVDRLVEFLRQHGLSAWCSRHHVRGAEQWHDEIGDALRRCNRFVLVLSPSALKSGWVKRELVYALNERHTKLCRSCIENAMPSRFLGRCTNGSSSTSPAASKMDAKNCFGSGACDGAEEKQNIGNAAAAISVFLRAGISRCLIASLRGI